LQEDNKNRTRTPLPQTIFRRLEKITDQWKHSGGILEDAAIFFVLLQILMNSDLSEGHLKRAIQICDRAQDVLDPMEPKSHNIQWSKINKFKKEFLRRINS